MKYSTIRGPCGIHSNVNGRGDGTARHLILLVYISVATDIGLVAIPSGSFVHFSIQRGPTFGGGDVASWTGSSGNQRKRQSGRPRLKDGHRSAWLDEPTVKILAKNYRGGGSHMLNVMHLMMARTRSSQKHIANLSVFARPRVIPVGADFLAPWLTNSLRTRLDDSSTQRS